MNDLAELEQLAGTLLRKASLGDRTRLLRTIARDLGKSQGSRIAAQLAPDGSAFAARKPKAAPTGRFRRKGAIRRKAMFRKLRLGKNLRGGATAEEAWVGFLGRAASIARVHQEGGEDAPAKGQKPVRYAQRVLLGDTEAERQRILDALLAHLAA